MTGLLLMDRGFADVAGRRVGLLGGSFDPPHAGHLHISRAALRIFGLHEVWWLVSPGNPLKSWGPAPLEARMEAARALIDTPRIKVSDFEARAGTRHTADTLRWLMRLAPRTRFVWLMGADNLAQIHLWQNWQEIFHRVPVGVFARPGQRQAALRSPAARRFWRWRLKGRHARLLADMAPPAWAFVNLSMVPISSSEIRERGEWASPGGSAGSAGRSVRRGPGRGQGRA